MIFHFWKIKILHKMKSGEYSVFQHWNVVFGHKLPSGQTSGRCYILMHNLFWPHVVF
jgi:hypothetical protein